MKLAIHNISSNDPNLQHSKLLAAGNLIYLYVEEHGSIGLTKTKAFNRKFVAWAADNLDWPNYSAKELYRVNRVLNESDIYPIWVLHDLLIITKMGRHYKSEFRRTKKGKTLSSIGRISTLFSLFQQVEKEIHDVIRPGVSEI
jgi:uncharacterized membrane protein